MGGLLKKAVNKFGMPMESTNGGMLKPSGVVAKALTDAKKQTAPTALNPAKPVAAPGAGTNVTIPKGEKPVAGGPDPHLILPPTTSAVQPAATAPAPPPPPPQTASDLGPDVTPGETSVENRMNGLLRKDNAYMQGAEAQGTQQARRRGLGSSTMAVQAAQTARINAALPIASQDASQSNTQLMQQRDIRSREMLSKLDRDQQDRIANMNVSASERTAASQLAASFESTYSQTMAAIMSNADLPPNARKQYTEHAGRVRDSNLRLVEQMYGIQLNWGGSSGGGSGSGGGGGTAGTGTPVPDKPLPEKAKQAKIPSNPKKGDLWVDMKAGKQYTYVGNSLGNSMYVKKNPGTPPGWELKSMYKVK